MTTWAPVSQNDSADRNDSIMRLVTEDSEAITTEQNQQFILWRETIWLT